MRRLAAGLRRLLQPVGLRALRLLDTLVQLGPETAGEAALAVASGVRDPAIACYRSRSRTDVGMWFRQGRVRVYLQSDGLLLQAHGRVPYKEHIAADELHASRYNHVMGTLVLAPATHARLRSLYLPPLEADAVLRHLGAGAPRVAEG